jgi:hypothetical protein
MAKRKIKVRVTKKQPKVKIAARQRRPGMSQEAVRYRELLLDPCLGQLEYPPVQGGDGGYLIRVKSIINLPQVAATNTGYGFWFHPQLGQWYEFEVANSNTALPTTYSLTVPGTNVLTGLSTSAIGGIAASYRAVASCATFSYNGAESSRAGRLAYSNLVSAEQFSDAVSSGITPAQLDTVCPQNVRIPQTSVQLRWKPDRSAVNFQDIEIAAAVNPTAFTNHGLMTNGMMFVVSGGSNTSNCCSVEIVTVYEWVPILNNTTNGMPSSGSRFKGNENLDDILNTIPDMLWTSIEGFQRTAMGIKGLMQGMSALAVLPQRIGATFRR